MTGYTLNHVYFVWLLDKINLSERNIMTSDQYGFLLDAMFQKTFYAVVNKDWNRSVDGELLREKFASEKNMKEPDLGDCRVLEMLVALSIRIENEVMYDHAYGDRTSEWFWMMVRNLGLLQFDNSHFSEKKVDEILTKFLDREYEPDGAGGLFPMKDSEKDQREIEIWWQMQAFILGKYW